VGLKVFMTSQFWHKAMTGKIVSMYLIPTWETFSQFIPFPGITLCSLVEAVSSGLDLSSLTFKYCSVLYGTKQQIFSVCGNYFLTVANKPAYFMGTTRNGHYSCQIFCHFTPSPVNSTVKLSTPCEVESVCVSAS